MIWANRWTGAALRLACLLDPELAARMDLQRLQATTPRAWPPCRSIRATGPSAAGPPTYWACWPLFRPPADALQGLRNLEQQNHKLGNFDKSV